MDSAVLDGTNLTDAVLEDAFAFNTRFINVTITGADFTNVPFRGDALKTLCAAAAAQRVLRASPRKGTLVKSAPVMVTLMNRVLKAKASSSTASVRFVPSSTAESNVASRRLL